MIDVFNTDAFSLVEMTEAINLLPHAPGRLEQMGIFREQGTTKLDIVIEYKEGRVGLVQTSTRGSRGSATTNRRADRRVETFRAPHILIEDGLMADDVQGVRAFGSENAVESVTQVVNEKLIDASVDINATLEFHRIGAIQGIILDADLSTLLNLFTRFSITETVEDFDFTVPADPTGALKQYVTTVKRGLETALGATPLTGIRAVCGDQFWDNFIAHKEVRNSYERWRDGEFLRTGQFREPFMWGDIQWENYRGKVGAQDFLPTGIARYFPVGAPGVFRTWWAPADYNETVNTMGRKMYAKQAVRRMDTGIDIEVQSNPLMLCTRPAVLIKGTGSNFPI